MKHVVIVSAHPDDEALGAGGTLLKHRARGDKIFWVIATSLFEDRGFSRERIESRSQEIRAVAERFGIEKTYCLDYPTMSLTSGSVNEMVPALSEIFHEARPEIVYCLNRSDAHSDHRYTFEAVMACTKSFRYPFVKRVLMYECLSETEFAPALPERAFLPNYYVDITPYLEEKLEIAGLYASEFAEHPFPRSLKNIEALATFRGASVGVRYAEAFQLLKYIDKDE